MSEMMTLTPAAEPMNLLADWISREHLAEELMITPDTLSRWEARARGSALRAYWPEGFLSPKQC